MSKGHWLKLSLALMLTLMLGGAAALADALPEHGPNPGSGRRVALASTEAKCLAVHGGYRDSTSATVRLQWEGQVEQAFLVLSAAGSEGGHSIYLNGQRVGNAPTHPGGQICQPGKAVTIPVLPGVLKKGENTITVTNDADINDGWAAANVYLEIHGVLNGPPVALLESDLPIFSPQSTRTSTTIVSGTIVLASSYELAHGYVISQVVWYQIPTDYTGSVSVPLLIAVHGMGGTGKDARDYLASEANNRGWLLAAPDMHGRYYTNHGKYALGWIGAQHDIIDTVEYMASHYTADLSRIYIAGGSMGGQTTALMTAKYPDVFPAAVPWKPFTSLSGWYYEIGALSPPDPYGDQKRIFNETTGTPLTRTFEYQRRSPIEIPQNSRRVPLKMWHDVDDALVPIHHSRDWRNAINGLNPPTPVALVEVPSGSVDCPPDGLGNDFEHCYDPPPAEIFDFLSSYTLNATAPLSLAIRTDESKSYYWLNLAQTGGDHWSQVETTYSLTDRTVTATISDTRPLTMAFNLGSTPVKGPGGIDRPGMGLPATTYLISGGDNYGLRNYTSGYLTVTLNSPGQFNLTISAIEAGLSASPTLVSGWQTSTSTLTASWKDYLNNPVPDGTTVQFSASAGYFPNKSSTYTVNTIEGQAVTVLTLPAAAASPEIAASAMGITATTSVSVTFPVYVPIVLRN